MFYHGSHCNPTKPYNNHKILASWRHLTLQLKAHAKKDSAEVDYSSRLEPRSAAGKKSCREGLWSLYDQDQIFGIGTTALCCAQEPRFTKLRTWLPCRLHQFRTFGKRASSTGLLLRNLIYVTLIISYFALWGHGIQRMQPIGAHLLTVSLPTSKRRWPR